MTKFDPSVVPVEDFDESIRVTEEQLARQQEKMEFIRGRLEWLIVGRSYAKGASQAARGSVSEIASGSVSRGVGERSLPASGSAAQMPGTALDETAALLRARLNGSRPSLRMAILITMLERPRSAGREHKWVPKEVVECVGRENWLSPDTKPDRVGKMLRDMAGRGEIEKESFGIFLVDRERAAEMVRDAET